MKKSIIIAGVMALLLTSTASYAATQKTPVAPQKPACEKTKPTDMQKARKHDRANLDERLKLTEEQKTKAHELRMQGHEKIKPIMEKIKAKHEEIRKIAEDTKLTQEQKDAKIFAIEKELLNLKHQARKIKTENMKKFESILTEEQKAELTKIKEEARARHEKEMKEHKGPRPHRPMPMGEKPQFEAPAK